MIEWLWHLDDGRVGRVYRVLEGGMTGQRGYCGWKKIRTGME